MKSKHEIMIQKFNEEVKLINDKFELYRSNLNRICNYFYEDNNFSI